ncbi:cellobiose phosphorylase [Halobacteroides halobius DSM 5150]|uniref:Cellobiose phosphorylase n=1 Tax=Halobacteroides halobius (strain ATCC 35273 / DSM 5150 / MD-1) TaxID=748449 RepID=L0K804_HALHC|nr:glycosyl hydrolase family 65 protein [Halobacteroides halobius]AGB40248.1 cellobiose phosphorylase [Halobacteroides halobius DSM 5150]
MVEEKKFENKYGYFTEDGREYVITDPKTPRPWANIISNGDYSFMVSQTGGGCSWRGNAGQNRLTRLYQDTIKDNWGKYMYIRDVESEEYWSAAWNPVQTDYDEYEVRHGIGYSVFNQKVNGIKSSMKVFVTPNDPVEILEVTVTNESDRVRKLDLTSYFEWEAGKHPDEHREFHKIFMDTEYDQDMKAVKLEKYLWGFPDKKGLANNVDWDYVGFHAVSQDVKSFDCDKETFVGMYSDEATPEGLEADKLAENQGRFGDAAAALQVDVTLEPGEEKTVVYTIGSAAKGKDEIEGVNNEPEDADKLIQEYTSVEGAKEAFKEVQEFWSELIDAEKVDTPDDALNFMTNYWLKYQAISCRLWAKSAYYQTSAGYGYRDQLQDSQIFLTSKPELARKQIIAHAEQQFQEGDVYHWWFTIGGGGPRTKCSDDLLWLPFILDAYLKETNDYTVLDEVVEFLDGGEADVYEHCKRAIEMSFSRFSPRGVPLMGHHDWNDGLSAIGPDMKGESFWVGEFLYMILESFIPLAEARDDNKFADKMKTVKENMKEAVNEYGWDGEWYLQATTDAGLKVGSKENEEGKIFLMPNIWAIMSGIADEERTETVIDSINEYLLEDYGTLLNYPAFTEPRTDIGYVTRYAPGLRENGGVYTHAATWSVWAYAAAGEGELAYEAYRRICPPNRFDNPDEYMAEPYVTPGNSDGPLSPMFGRGGWTWYTGSSQWLQRVATNWILGVRADYDGLIVDPCIPAEWDGYTMKRKFRNTTYQITVDNSVHVNQGVKEIKLDGEAIEGNKLPDLDDGEEHQVEVTLG